MNKEAWELLNKNRSGSLTEEERARLESWYNHHAASAETFVSKQDLSETLDEIWDNLPVQNEVLRRHQWYKRIAVAASLFLAVSISAWFLVNKRTEVQFTIHNKQQGIQPGGSKAILTLADGSKIILDEVKNGNIANQGSISIRKTADGKVIYDASALAVKGTATVAYNTIETPRGGQYQVLLPDGSQVWLNAASSIRFPTSFQGDERKVEITGEAYFEVAKNPAKPFRVMSSGQIIDVLGTHFNINAYSDEKITRTTLLEGSLKVTKGSESTLLSPGQQTQIGSFAQIRLIKDIDTEEAIAWKNGYFMFNHEDIGSVMRKISRWYDLEIIYSGRVSDDWFGGTVSRYKNVSEVLSKLELTDQVHFKIEGRTIMVLP